MIRTAAVAGGAILVGYLVTRGGSGGETSMPERTTPPGDAPGQDSGGLPAYVQDFAPGVRAEVAELSAGQIDALPGPDSDPLSTPDLQQRLGREPLIDPSVIPDSDPVQLVRSYFRGEANR